MVHIRKESRIRASGDRKPARRKVKREQNSVTAAIVGKPIPSRARLLLVGLAIAAFESAVSDNSEAALVGFLVVRETFLEVNGIFEQMSRDSGSTDHLPRKGPGKNMEVPERKKSSPANR